MNCDEKLNEIELKYQSGKIDFSQLVSQVYLVGIDHGKSLVKETDSLPCVSGSIIDDLEARLYSLSLKKSKMKVGDFKNIPEVKEIMTAIAVLEKYYR